ncbi:unnamed protein product [Haemonchus placei]|uniref:Uncharacterized protein n=1 Tax=Haemonchus placei TaxID=6290 RepID=A0A3P7YPS0_HAEPC|nr:unnamed protein product [Haemonchus placei]
MYSVVPELLRIQIGRVVVTSAVNSWQYRDHLRKLHHFLLSSIGVCPVKCRMRQW